MFIDTHSHLFLWELAHHISEAVEHLKANNFSHSIQIGTSVQSSKTCIELAQKYNILRATIWIHPCEAQDISVEEIPTQIEELENLIKNHRSEIVWFGEIGFDYYHLSSTPEEAEKQKARQFEWFHAQVKIAMKYDLPVVIHTRNCSDVTLAEIEKSGLKKFVVHCFSENWEFAQRVFAYSDNAYISFTGILTYPKSTSVQEVSTQAPLKRIMIETDAPYLIPEKLKWTVEYCEPFHSILVFDKLCELRSESKEEIEKQLWENSVQFFWL